MISCTRLIWSSLRLATAQIDCGQHFLAAFDAVPSKTSSDPAFLKDFIMTHIITVAVIGVKHRNFDRFEISNNITGPFEI